MVPVNPPSIRASEICQDCCFTLKEVQMGGRQPEIVAMRWEVISTMTREGYKTGDIASLVGLCESTCRDYFLGRVHASRDVHVRNALLDGVKKVQWRRKEDT